MRILLCHNYYQQPGGEDRVFDAEGSLLESHGHKVLRYTANNDRIKNMGRVELLRRTIWSTETYDDVRVVLRRFRPDVMHCHNTFPLLSPSIYKAANEMGVPVVQTLHNYRLLCLGATLYRERKPCEECLYQKKGKPTATVKPWPGVQHLCYRQNFGASAAAAAMLQWHHWRHTWAKMVDHYIAPCKFVRQKFLEAGFSPNKISVKPNFIDPDRGEGNGNGYYAVFVGRLSPEKGIDTLLAAWSQLPENIPLRIAGDGPLADMVQKAAYNDPRIKWLGHCNAETIHATLQNAACLIMPSTWYETFGLTIVEAFAAGTPVIASRLGAMEELVTSGKTGLHFEPGNAADLTANVQRMFANTSQRFAMRLAARHEYEQLYTADINYRLLMDTYRHVGANVEFGDFINV